MVYDFTIPWRGILLSDGCKNEYWPLKNTVGKTQMKTGLLRAQGIIECLLLAQSLQQDMLRQEGFARR